MAPRACGASMPGTAAARSPMRSRLRWSSSITPRPSRWAIRLLSQAAEALAAILPDGMGHVFFVNSGSEAADTALKMARAYHVARGEPERVWLVGRERGYHGVNFGGISVGGIANNRAAFGPLLPRSRPSSLTPTTPERNAFSRGQPEHGAELADDLLRIIGERGADKIAAVIVEPMAGSTGVLPAAQGLSRAAPSDLRRAWHLAYLRRGHHRLRPPRRAVRRAALRGHPRHHHHGQGPDQRRDSDGRGRGPRPSSTTR